MYLFAFNNGHGRHAGLAGWSTGRARLAVPVRVLKEACHRGQSRGRRAEERKAQQEQASAVTPP